MGRIRSVKPGFFKSLDIAELDRETRLHFIGLWTYADDDGRGIDDPRLIKADVWPLDDDVTSDDIERFQAELEKRGRIVRYSDGQRRYFEIHKWHDHQKPNRPTPSKLPSGDDEGCHPLPVHEGSRTAHARLTEDARPEGRGEEGNGDPLGGDGASAVNDNGDRAFDGQPVSPDADDLDSALPTFSKAVDWLHSSHDADQPDTDDIAELCSWVVRETAKRSDREAAKRLVLGGTRQYAKYCLGVTVPEQSITMIGGYVKQYGAERTFRAVLAAVNAAAGTGERWEGDDAAFGKYVCAVITGERGAA